MNCLSFIAYIGYIYRPCTNYKVHKAWLSTAPTTPSTLHTSSSYQAWLMYASTNYCTRVAYCHTPT